MVLPNGVFFSHIGEETGDIILSIETSKALPSGDYMNERNVTLKAHLDAEHAADLRDDLDAAIKRVEG